MDQFAYVIIAVLVLILLVVIGLLFVLVFRLLKNPPPPKDSAKEFQPEMEKRFTEVKKKNQAILKQNVYCSNHPEEVGETTCAICGNFFCHRCIKTYKAMHLCNEHLALIMKNDWEEIITIKSHTDDTEAGVKLVEVKQKWWDEEELATYIETHYKINIDGDYVETYLVLFGIKTQIDNIKRRLGGS